jgi:predicted choloylglycine hydrolase
MRALKTTAICVGILLMLPIIVFVVVFTIGTYVEYDLPKEHVSADSTRLQIHDGYKVYDDNMLRQSNNGLWEMYLEGRPEERGTAYGMLAKELIRHQESTFIGRIKEIISSETYLNILRRIVICTNRNIDHHIADEYRSEIYGMSQVCSPEFDELVGNAYDRQLNFHGAHDIGHAMQRYMLVGCTAFAAWDNYTADSAMIVGRNFDFYFGDEFARNKMIVFVNPTEGIPFVSVSWPAMMGVVSGMNSEGITVTLNAAAGPLDINGKTPVSILARQIVQYAHSIDEAVAIAEQTETSVSEQIFVCSAKERKAIVIEKSPDMMDVCLSDTGAIALTNHYRSNSLHDIESYPVSERRLLRTEELINRQKGKLTTQHAVDILRDYRDRHNNPLPIGSEEAVCQFISHHSVIFKPDSLQMWVSTSPWQLGKYVCYDMRKIMEHRDFSAEITLDEHSLPADSAMIQMYNNPKEQCK